MRFLLAIRYVLPTAVVFPVVVARLDSQGFPAGLQLLRSLAAVLVQSGGFLAPTVVIQ